MDGVGGHQGGIFCFGLLVYLGEGGGTVKLHFVHTEKVTYMPSLSTVCIQGKINFI